MFGGLVGLQSWGSELGANSGQQLQYQVGGGQLDVWWSDGFAAMRMRLWVQGRHVTSSLCCGASPICMWTWHQQQHTHTHGSCAPGLFVGM
jgi:hypothetical protein